MTLSANPPAPTRARILIVEDDPAIREGLELNLSLEGHHCDTAADGEQAIVALERAPASGRPFDLVLLDVMLPGKNGFEVLRTIRAIRPELPVLLLTARAEEADKILGLELGADDYIVKPFGLGELRARIRAALRRAGLQAHVGQPVRAFGDVEVDRDGHRVRRHGEDVPMTAREFSLLLFFLDNPERVLSREALLRRVWGLEHATLRTVDNFVMRLRQKLEPDPDAPRHLVTVRGVGYRFAPTGAEI